MLLLKLLLVPTLLVLVTLVGKRWGPGIAGWLSGLPFTSGPILFIVALEQGSAFASTTAAVSLSGVFATIAFCAAYAHASLRFNYPIALLAAALTWVATVNLLSLLPLSTGISLTIALLSLLIAPRLFPKPQGDFIARPVPASELVIRACALLTLAVTFSAEKIGTSWSGLLTTYPVLGMVLAIFSHHRYGANFVIVLLRAMATSMYSFTAFFLVLSPLLAEFSAAAPPSLQRSMASQTAG